MIPDQSASKPEKGLFGKFKSGKISASPINSHA